MSEKEPLPVNSAVNVIDYETIYRTQKWWKVVALVNKFGHDEVATYLWIMDEKGKWRRKQKMSIKNSDEWEKVIAAHEKFLPRIRQMRGK
jgi:hypothetical protein